MTVLPDKRVAFAPNRLTDAALAEHTVKRAAIGAALVGNFHLLPCSTSAQVLWECEMFLEAPAMVKPVKPKLWLMAKTTLKSDTYYRVW